MAEAKRDEVPLPPLPKADIRAAPVGQELWPFPRVDYFSTETLQAYGRQCAQAERERCAKVCEGHGTGGFSYAAAIRSQNLIKE